MRAAVRERSVHHAVRRRGRRAARTIADYGRRGSEGRLRYQCLLVVSAYNEHTLITSPLVYLLIMRRCNRHHKYATTTTISLYNSNYTSIRIRISHFVYAYQSPNMAIYFDGSSKHQPNSCCSSHSMQTLAPIQSSTSVSLGLVGLLVSLAFHFSF